MSNIDLIHLLFHVLAAQTGKPEEDYTKLITFVPNRPGYGRKYALDCGKLQASLSWATSVPVKESWAEPISSLQDWI